MTAMHAASQYANGWKQPCERSAERLSSTHSGSIAIGKADAQRESKGLRAFAQVRLTAGLCLRRLDMNFHYLIQQETI